MARKERKKKSDKILEQIRISESYKSLILGFLVVFIAGVLAFSFARSRFLNSQKTETVVQKERVENTSSAKIYTVSEGDTLGIIAEKMYGSRDFWAEIAATNTLSNPDIVEVGTQLKIPPLKPRKEVAGASESIYKTDPIKGDSYTVQEGDYLWDIAVRAYGDGFRWIDIAQVNNLPNSDFLEPEMTLKIPR